LSEIRQLSASVSQGNLKDVEHDLKIADIQRRLIALETKK
jgi:hypothetical protein